MKLELQPPYSTDWAKGYLVTNPEGRRSVILFNSSAVRSTTAYARYLLSVKLGRYLTEEEQADHIDGDRTNDAIENLQVLSQQDNIAKSRKYETLHDRVCRICGGNFTLTSRQNHRLNPTCSRKCGRVSASIKLTKKEIWV